MHPDIADLDREAQLATRLEERKALAAGATHW